MSSAVQVEIASDQVHEGVVAEVLVDGKFVCLLSNDDDQLLVEFPSAGLDESLIARSVSLENLLAGLAIARKRLED